MNEYGDLKKVLDGIALDIRMGKPIALELKPLVDQHFTQEYKSAVKWGPALARGVIGSATQRPRSESAAPKRNILDLIRALPDTTTDAGSYGGRGALDSEPQRFLGIQGIPNVYRDALDDEEPRMPPPAKYLGT